MSSFSEYETKVIEWAEDRKIIPNAKPIVQLMKTVSELGELCDAEIKGHRGGMIDGLGDVLVTLIIYAELRGMDITGCLAFAYDEIKDRKGELLANGTFVKEVTA